MRTYIQRAELTKVLQRIKCDVCNREANMEPENIMEFQEFVHIGFSGGYGSVFGDENDFELDICQHCLKERVGAFIRNVTVTP